MKNRRKLIVGAVTVAAVAVLGTGSAFAFRGMGGPFFGPKKIFEKVKAELGLSAEQVKKIEALRERVKAHFKAKKGDRKGFMQEAKALWLADKIDDARMDALHAKMKARHAEAKSLRRGAMKELHQILTKEQRQKVVQLLEEFHAKMKARWQKHRQ
jgi:Spy/CpxP family protein refolding chaperone